MRDHRDVASADETVEALAAKYRDVLVEMDSRRIKKA
jgi:hypothetical protein